MWKSGLFFLEKVREKILSFSFKGITLPGGTGVICPKRLEIAMVVFHTLNTSRLSIQ